MRQPSEVKEVRDNIRHLLGSHWLMPLNLQGYQRPSEVKSECLLVAPAAGRPPKVREIQDTSPYPLHHHHYLSAAFFHPLHHHHHHYLSAATSSIAIPCHRARERASQALSRSGASRNTADASLKLWGRSSSGTVSRHHSGLEVGVCGPPDWEGAAGEGGESERVFVMRQRQMPSLGPSPASATPMIKELCARSEASGRPPHTAYFVPPSHTHCMHASIHTSRPFSSRTVHEYSDTHPPTHTLHTTQRMQSPTIHTSPPPYTQCMHARTLFTATAALSICWCTRAGPASLCRAASCFSAHFCSCSEATGGTRGSTPSTSSGGR